jgi:hypothetical protein
MFGMRRREFIALLGLRAREPGVHQATMYFSVNPFPLELAARRSRGARSAGPDSDTREVCRHVRLSRRIESRQGHCHYSDCYDRTDDSICFEPAVKFGRISRIVSPDAVFHDTPLPGERKETIHQGRLL